MGRPLTEEEIKRLDILSGKEFFLMHLIETYADKGLNFICKYPPAIEKCMYFFFNEYGYTAGNKVVEISQLENFHLKIKEEMVSIIMK